MERWREWVWHRGDAQAWWKASFGSHFASVPSPALTPCWMGASSISTQNPVSFRLSHRQWACLSCMIVNTYLPRNSSHEYSPNCSLSVHTLHFLCTAAAHATPHQQPILRLATNASALIVGRLVQAICSTPNVARDARSALTARAKHCCGSETSRCGRHWSAVGHEGGVKCGVSGRHLRGNVSWGSDSS